MSNICSVAGCWNASMTLSEAMNFLRILYNLDRHELVEGGAIPDTEGAWQRFTSDPPRAAIRMDDERADRLWTVMQRRMIPPKSDEQMRQEHEARVLGHDRVRDASIMSLTSIGEET